MTNQPELEANAADWLTLTDYSSKYRVSVSTLRRRIRTGQIENKFEAGKYLLKDVVPPIQEPEVVNVAALEALSKGNEEQQEPLLSTATKLLNELKKAYMSILQEKEEQIVQLKEEVTDLKTLVRVLEQENDRLRYSYLREHQ
jgi:hypothetical protein